MTVKKPTASCPILEAPLPKLKFLNGLKVKVTSIVAVLAVVISTVWTEAQFRASIMRDVADLKIRLEALDGQLTELQADLAKFSPSQWDKKDMVQWIRETRAQNQDWKPAPLVYEHEDGTITVIMFTESSANQIK